MPWRERKKKIGRLRRSVVATGPRCGRMLPCRPLTPVGEPKESSLEQAAEETAAALANPSTLAILVACRGPSLAPGGHCSRAGIWFPIPLGAQPGRREVAPHGRKDYSVRQKTDKAVSIRSRHDGQLKPPKECTLLVIMASHGRANLCASSSS